MHLNFWFSPVNPIKIVKFHGVLLKEEMIIYSNFWSFPVKSVYDTMIVLYMQSIIFYFKNIAKFCADKE